MGLVRGKEAHLESSKLSFINVIPEDIEKTRKDSLLAYTCLSSVAQTTTETDYTNLEMIARKRSSKDLHTLMSDVLTTIDRNESISFTSVLAYNKSHYEVLMDNVHILEDRIANANSVELEKNILVQLGRIGALELFRSCLSRTTIEPPASDRSCKPSETAGDDHREEKVNTDANKVIIMSRKKEKRKSRREKLPEKDEKLVSFHLVSRAAKKAKTQSRKQSAFKNEAEMAHGIKVVANLERIRTSMEKEMGREVSMRSWAEAAEIDEKLLQKRLRYGWQCRDELIKSARSLVLYIAKNYRGLGIAPEDLIQAGNVGVLQGAERFDQTRGYKFSTYVQYWIRKAMSVLKSSGDYPDDLEIAKFTGLSLQKIKSASRCLRVVGSTDQNVGDWSTTKLSEFTVDKSVDSPERTVMRKHMKHEITELMSELNPKERQVLVLRYGFGGQQCRSLHEVGVVFNVSKEWIRRVEKRALTKLRNESNKTNLKHYFDI
ncbi:hypothetical protein V2J09_005296 [Rumex salicifolius]